MKKTLTKRILASVFLAAIITIPALDSASAASPAYCDRYARDQANYAAPPGSGAIPGAIGGAVVGAIIGGIAGGGRGAGTGAAIGAGVGGIGGAAGRSRRWHNVYNAEYDNCLYGSRRSNAGYNQAPPRWSDEWYDYCASKYRSFNPATGKYLSNSGSYRYCR